MIGISEPRLKAIGKSLKALVKEQPGALESAAGDDGKLLAQLC